MPTHVYHPLRTPPRWTDRVMVHPIDNAIAVLSIAAGAIVLLARIIPAFVPSQSMERMPAALGILLGALAIAGGVLALVGLHWHGETVSTGWLIEQAGWAAVGASFASYAVSVTGRYPQHVISWLIPAIIAAAALLRVASLRLIERDTRRAVAAVQDDTEKDAGGE